MTTPSSRLSSPDWHRPAQQDRSTRTEHRLLEAAERLMSLRPFHEISVAEITQEAEASVSSFYARFPSKEALLGALFRQHTTSAQAMFAELFAPDRWADVSLAEIMRQTIPAIVAGYQQQQGLVRALLIEASKDERLRSDWNQAGDQIVAGVTELCMSRCSEIDHLDPEVGMEHMLEICFATLAHRIEMHEIDDPDMSGLVDSLTLMVIRYMGITE